MKGNIQMTNECINTSLFIRGIQIKTTVRFYYIFIRMSKLKHKQYISVGKNVEQLEFSEKCYLGNSSSNVYFKRPYVYPMTQHFHIQNILVRICICPCVCVCMCVYTHMFTVALNIIGQR